MSLIKIKQIAGLQAKLDLIDSQLASGSLKSDYTQASHGFVAGEVIAFFNGAWVLADATTADKLGRLVVESVDGNTFTAVQIGTITVASWNLTPGTFYVVDETGTGSIQAFVDPSNPAFQYSNPVLQALTATTAHVLPWRPSLGAEAIPQGQEYTQSNLTPTDSSGNDSPTGITLDYTPFADSTVQVYINGVAVTETYGDKTGDVYFSADGGVTSKAVADLVAGDELYWNANIAGYEIGGGDFFDVVYEKNSLD
jgi:hypothetical protein